MTCRLRWCVEIETIWWTFGRIQWYVIPEPHIILQGAAIGEFTVTIPEPHATLQGALTWRNQCHDRATLQGVRIPSAIFKIVFLLYFILFLFLMQFRLRRAAAFVSSPIHLFGKQLMTMTLCYNNRPPTLSLIPVIYNSLGQNKSKELESRRHEWRATNCCLGRK